MKKITDIEKFALEHIFRPYQDMIGLGYTTIRKLPMPIDDILDFAEENEEWWELVSDRIRGIKFTFPEYINHPIAEYFRDGKRRKGENIYYQK